MVRRGLSRIPRNCSAVPSHPGLHCCFSIPLASPVIPPQPILLSTHTVLGEAADLCPAVSNRKKKKCWPRPHLGQSSNYKAAEMQGRATGCRMRCGIQDRGSQGKSNTSCSWLCLPTAKYSPTSATQQESTTELHSHTATEQHVPA